METVGFFTLSLQLIRWLIELYPRFMDFLSTLPNGLVSQLLLLAFVWLVIPRLVDLGAVAVKVVFWIMKKFE